MRKPLAALLVAALALSWGCWWQSSPKTTSESKPTGVGPGTGGGATGPSGRGTGRTQETLPDR
jgi:hypothetical protein